MRKTTQETYSKMLGNIWKSLTSQTCVPKSQVNTKLNLQRFANHESNTLNHPYAI